VTLAHVNSLDRATFVDAIGWIFEDSPWIAERAWHGRPFESIERLHETMAAVMFAASTERQLVLLRAHPDLGTKLKMTAASTGEQQRAGLDRLSPELIARLSELNALYREKFGFPFLFAVKGSTGADVLEALERRLACDRNAEFEEALQQVARIAWFRLESIVTR
jgi:OHCU decarboxylase